MQISESKDAGFRCRILDILFTCVKCEDCAVLPKIRRADVFGQKSKFRSRIDFLVKNRNFRKNQNLRQKLKSGLTNCGPGKYFFEL